MSLHRQKEKQEYELNNLCLPVPYYKQDSEQTTLRQTPYKTPHHFIFHCWVALGNNLQQ